MFLNFKENAYRVNFLTKLKEARKIKYGPAVFESAENAVYRVSLVEHTYQISINSINSFRRYGSSKISTKYMNHPVTSKRKALEKF